MARGIFRRTPYKPFFKRKVWLTPTITPSFLIGDRFIVGVGATGAWVGRDDDIATLASLGPTVWSFTVPKKGYTLYVDDENEHYKFNGATWELI